MHSSTAQIRFIWAVIIACLPLLAVGADLPKQADWQTYKAWAQQHNKAYLDDPKELLYRYKVWSANVGRIKLQAASNAARGVTHRLGLNAHSDLTREEFRAAYLGAPMTLSDRSRQQEGKLAGTSSSRNDSPERLCVFGKVVRLVSTLLGRNTDQQAAIRKQQQVTEEHWRFENVSAPAAVDWRKHKPAVLGSIKDQHVNGTPCGSCWAFSAVSIMEIASAMATGRVVLGSEQHLIDCDRKYDHGCEGGGWLNAIQYTIKNKGLATEKQYPYTGKDGTCNKLLAKQRHTLKVDSWEDVPFSNESALAQAVSQTPVIVAICAGPAIDEWHAYAGGIFDAPCCEKDSEVTLDHGIVVVGYGSENGVDYWILKNSWGTHWGEQGFMRIRRNHGKHGKCALASYPAMVFRKPLPDVMPSTMAGQQQPAAGPRGIAAA